MADFFPNDINNDHCLDNEHKAADCCDDQLPLFSTLGRGIKGDSFRVRVSEPDTCTETYLIGESYDEAEKVWKSEWLSENINGGELSYQYNLRPYTIPQTFTITFIYRRPKAGNAQRDHDGIPIPNGGKNCSYHETEHDCCWSWTTPAIPYIWTNNDGGITSPDDIVGSGVATIFARASKSEAWSPAKHERLWYPEGTNRDDYNAPLAEEAWSATITFGYGGDIEIPNFDDIAKILGVSKQDIFNILEDKTFTIDGITADNFRDWILKHLHKDLGFESDGATGSNHGWNNKFGGEANVKDYIDKWIEELHEDLGFGTDNDGDKDFGGYKTVKLYIDAQITNLRNELNNKYEAYIKNIYGLLDDIVGHIYGASTTTSDSSSNPSSNVPEGQGQKINWPSEPSSDSKIPLGNINVLSNDRSKAIITHTGNTTGDVKAQ